MNNMIKVWCDQTYPSVAVWANSCTKDKTNSTFRCTACGKVGHGVVRG